MKMVLGQLLMLKSMKLYTNNIKIEIFWNHMTCQWIFHVFISLHYKKNLNTDRYVFLPVEYEQDETLQPVDVGQNFVLLEIIYHDITELRR